VTQSETALTVARHDRWSAWPFVVAIPAVVLLWCSIVWNADMLTTLLVAFINVVIFGTAVIGMLVCLVTRRVRAAWSALAVAAVVAGGFAARLTILNAARYADFAKHRAGYEQTVEAWRAKNPNSAPLRLVLYDADVSTFVVPAIFDYIVFDESDAIGREPPVLSGNWLCADHPGCGNGPIDTGPGRSVIQSFGGHFYFVEQVL
jgi:hypothetical protein